MILGGFFYCAEQVLLHLKPPLELLVGIDCIGTERIPHGSSIVIGSIPVDAHTAELRS
jgi:hypothetical protein